MNDHPETVSKNTAESRVKAVDQLGAVEFCNAAFTSPSAGVRELAKATKAAACRLLSKERRSTG
jgi:hypothetical protein